MGKKSKLVLVALFALLLSVSLTGDIQLQWDPNSEPDLAGYNVKRGTAAGGPYTNLNTEIIAGTTYTDPAANLDSGPQYYYVVTAVDTSGLESGPSNEVDNYGPGNPSGLRIVQSGMNARLFWNETEDAIGYKVYLTESLEEPWQSVGMTLRPRFRYKVPDKNTDYFLTVTALYTGGVESDFGEVVQYVGKVQR